MFFSPVQSVFLVEVHSHRDYVGLHLTTGRPGAATDSQTEAELVAIFPGETNARSSPRRTMTPSTTVSGRAISTAFLSGSASALSSRRHRQKEKGEDLNRLFKIPSQPMKANVNISACPSQTPAQPARDSVDYSMDFLGAMIKAIKDPASRQNVVKEITNIVMKRRTETLSEH